MSHETVRRYWVKKGHLLCKANAGDPECDCQTPCIKLVDASDYDALRTQARELAERLLISRRVWYRLAITDGEDADERLERALAYDADYQLAQAVLKEGA